jgi:hypothetical protein
MVENLNIDLLDATALDVPYEYRSRAKPESRIQACSMGQDGWPHHE